MMAPDLIAYISSDGRTVQEWDGAVIGRVIESTQVRLARDSWVHGSTYRAYRVALYDGRRMYGRSSPGIAIALRQYKGDKGLHSYYANCATLP